MAAAKTKGVRVYREKDCEDVKGLWAGKSAIGGKEDKLKIPQKLKTGQRLKELR